MRFVKIKSQKKTTYLIRKLHLNIILCLLLIFAHAALADENTSIISTGNLALPTSQQPGPFYSFGSNIIDKGQCQISFTPDIFKSTGERFLEYSTNILYATTSESSLLLVIPSELEYTNKSNNLRYYGFGDVTLQGEYAFYDTSSSLNTKQVNGIVGITVPSGATKVSYERATYFIAGNANYVGQEWLTYVAPGVLLFAGSEKIRPGTQYYCDIGLGKNIASKPNQYIALALLELNAQYNSPTPGDKFKPKAKHSGNVVVDGYLFYLTPSLFFSTKSTVYQIGASIPIAQHWANTKNLVDYYVAFNFTWTINPEN